MKVNKLSTSWCLKWCGVEDFTGNQWSDYMLFGFCNFRTRFEFVSFFHVDEENSTLTASAAERLQPVLQISFLLTRISGSNRKEVTRRKCCVMKSFIRCALHRKPCFSFPMALQFSKNLGRLLSAGFGTVFRHVVGLLGPGVGPSQGFYLRSQYPSDQDPHLGSRGH
jgi:hypothetical protein